MASSGDDGPARLEISNGRLYWVEQARITGSAVTPWRIVSLPL